MFIKKGFTLIEIVLIIILIGIMYTISLNNINTDYSVYDYQNLKNNLIQYENNIKINNKINIIPENNSFKEKEKIKYWFKQNLSFVIENKCNKIFSYIMSDNSYNQANKNFDKKITEKKEIYKENGNYDIGLDNSCDNNYPNKENIKKSFLYNYITKIEIYKDGDLYQTITNQNNKKIAIFFYNNSIYLNEGDAGDNGSVVFYNNERNFVKDNIELKLYNKEKNKYIIKINSLGFVN